MVRNRKISTQTKKCKTKKKKKLPQRNSKGEPPDKRGHDVSSARRERGHDFYDGCPSPRVGQVRYSSLPTLWNSCSRFRISEASRVLATTPRATRCSYIPRHTRSGHTIHRTMAKRSTILTSPLLYNAGQQQKHECSAMDLPGPGDLRQANAILAAAVNARGSTYRTIDKLHRGDTSACPSPIKQFLI